MSIHISSDKMVHFSEESHVCKEVISMFTDYEKICLMFVSFGLVFLVVLMLFGSDEKVDVKANRYSSCIERQSEIGKLEYEEMKEVCSEYLD